MKLLIKLIFVLYFLFISGCATTNSLRNASVSSGVPRSFNAEFDRVLNVARESIVEAGLQIEDVYQTNENSWTIISLKPSSAFSYGELVRVVVQKTYNNTTLVRVLTKRRLATNIFAKGDYSTSIFSNMELKLK